MRHTSTITTQPELATSPDTITEPIRIPSGDTIENSIIDATRVFQLILDFIISIPKHNAIIHL